MFGEDNRARGRTFEKNLVNSIGSFEIGQASHPFPSINYELSTDILKTVSILIELVKMDVLINIAKAIESGELIASGEDSKYIVWCKVKGSANLKKRKVNRDFKQRRNDTKIKDRKNESYCLHWQMKELQ